MVIDFVSFVRVETCEGQNQNPFDTLYLARGLATVFLFLSLVELFLVLSTCHVLLCFFCEIPTPCWFRNSFYFPVTNSGYTSAKAYNARRLEK